MALTLHLPAKAGLEARRRTVSDATVALAFALFPVLLFALAVAVFGVNPIFELAGTTFG